MDPGEALKQTGFRLPVSTLAKLDRISKLDHRNRTQMVITLIEKAAKESEANDDGSS